MSIFEFCVVTFCCEVICSFYPYERGAEREDINKAIQILKKQKQKK